MTIKVFKKDATSVSHAGESFDVADDGTVVVPDELAHHLVESHGFEYLPEPDPKKAKKGVTAS